MLNFKTMNSVCNNKCAESGAKIIRGMKIAWVAETKTVYLPTAEALKGGVEIANTYKADRDPTVVPMIESKPVYIAPVKVVAPVKTAPVDESILAIANMLVSNITVGKGKNHPITFETNKGSFVFYAK